MSSNKRRDETASKPDPRDVRRAMDDAERDVREQCAKRGIDAPDHWIIEAARYLAANSLWVSVGRGGGNDR